MLKRIHPTHPYLRSLNFIGGRWVEPHNKQHVPVHFPAAATADAAPIGTIPQSAAVDARDAVDAAHRAYYPWSSELAQHRADMVRKLGAALIAKKDDLAEIICAESGKPQFEAQGEVMYSASYCTWYAAQAEQGYGMILPRFRPGVRPLVMKVPKGVVSIVSPWNFPLAMLFRGVVGALAAGCTVVAKPSDLTPFTATALANIVEEVGFPEGAFNVVHTRSPGPVVEAWNQDPRVRKVCFTGSVRVGKLIAAGAAQTMKSLSLELGGNAPFIVFDDADLDEAVSGFMSAKFRNSGQTCICPNRILVHEDVEAKFVEALIERFAALKIGNTLADASCNMGPLITRNQRDRVHKLVTDAKAAGARVLCGGHTLENLGPNFYEPTIVDRIDATRDNNMLREEIFGPLIPIRTFKTEHEAMAIANDVPVGLASYVYTQNHKRMWRMSTDLEYGMIGVNESMISSATIPFGGMKDSGVGREGGPGSIDKFMDWKYVCKNVLDD